MNHEFLIRPDGVLYFTIIAYSLDDVYFKAKNKLESQFSKIALESSTLIGWNLKSENPSLKTKLVCFRQRIHRDELPLIKHKTINIVNKISKDDLSFRILPGYISEYNVILSNTKDDFHRVYLFKGVYAEVIYKYEKRRLVPFENLPNYFSNKEVIYNFTNLREYFLNSKTKLGV
jgi:hypothetical protein